MTKEIILQSCIVEDNIVKLPAGQLDKKLYQEVAKSLNLIGGKWKGGKIMGFLFEADPTELLEQIGNGEKRNLKKEFQFFATPDHLADRLVELANIQEGQLVLEPSAGQGAIVKAIINTRIVPFVDCFELMPVNQSILNSVRGSVVLGSDFLAAKAHDYYDRIIANPPFSKNQDVDHVLEMYACLKKRGRLVSIMSRHWMESSNKKEVSFRNWLDEVGADIQLIDGGEFSESGTKIATCIVIIKK